jgi:hypothetical protein
LSDFSNYSWEDVEHLVGKLFEKKGYEVRVTQKTGDSGIDVWAEKDGIKIGIQVKHWSADVGVVEATQTLGAGVGKAHKCILISTKSFFTSQALEYQIQHSHDIELWDSNRFKEELGKYDLNFPDSKQPITFVRDTKTNSIQAYAKSKEENPKWLPLAVAIVALMMELRKLSGIKIIGWIAVLVVGSLFWIYIDFLDKPESSIDSFEPAVIENEYGGSTMLYRPYFLVEEKYDQMEKDGKFLGSEYCLLLVKKINNVYAQYQEPFYLEWLDKCVILGEEPSAVQKAFLNLPTEKKVELLLNLCEDDPFDPKMMSGFYEKCLNEARKAIEKMKQESQSNDI